MLILKRTLARAQFILVDIYGVFDGPHHERWSSSTHFSIVCGVY